MRPLSIPLFPLNRGIKRLSKNPSPSGKGCGWVQIDSMALTLALSRLRERGIWYLLGQSVKLIMSHIFCWTQYVGWVKRNGAEWIGVVARTHHSQYDRHLACRGVPQASVPVNARQVTRGLRIAATTTKMGFDYRFTMIDDARLGPLEEFRA